MQRFIPLRKLSNRPLEPSDCFIEVPQLHDERRKRLADFNRDRLVAGLNAIGQFSGVFGPCGAITPTSLMSPEDAPPNSNTSRDGTQMGCFNDNHLGTARL